MEAGRRDGPRGKRERVTKGFASEGADRNRHIRTIPVTKSQNEAISTGNGDTRRGRPIAAGKKLKKKTATLVGSTWKRPQNTSRGRREVNNLGKGGKVEPRPMEGFTPHPVWSRRSFHEEPRRKKLQPTYANKPGVFLGGVGDGNQKTYPATIPGRCGPWVVILLLNLGRERNTKEGRRVPK